MVGIGTENEVKIEFTIWPPFLGVSWRGGRRSIWFTPLLWRWYRTTTKDGTYGAYGPFMTSDEIL